MNKYQALISAFSNSTQGQWAVDQVPGLIRDENNVTFICQAQNLMPDILADLQRLQQIDERLQWLEAELHRVRDRAGKLESALYSAGNVMQSMRCQIEQMRGIFDDEDEAIQSACTEHDDVEQLIAQVTAK